MKSLASVDMLVQFLRTDFLVYGYRTAIFDYEVECYGFEVCDFYYKQWVRTLS